MDLSQLSDQQLMDIAGISAPQAAPAVDLSSVSDTDLMQLAGISKQPAATAGEPMTAGKAFTGGMLDLGNKVSFGAMDEIVAGANTMIDDVKAGALNLFGYNEKPGDYDARLAEARGLQKAYQEYAPVSSAINNVGGVFAPMPSIFGKAGQAAPSLLSTAGKSAAVGAGYGAAGGFLSGEGSTANRVSNAETGAAIGGALGAAVPVVAKGVSGAAKYIGNKFSDAADAVQETGLGIMYGDKSRGLKSLPKYLNEAGEVVDIPTATSVDAPIEQQMKLVRDLGILDNAPNDPRALKTYLKQTEQEVGDSLQKLISDANKSLGTEKLPVQFSNTARFFDDIGQQNPAKAGELITDFQKVLDNYEKAGSYFNPASNKDINKPLGAVTRINSVKTGVNSMIKKLWDTERDDVKVNLYRAIYKDLQAAEEGAVLAALPERIDEFKTLKDTYGALVGLGQTVNKAGARKALTLSNAIEGGSKAAVTVGAVSSPILGAGALPAAGLAMLGKGALNVAEKAYPMTASKIYQSTGNLASGASSALEGAIRSLNPSGGLIAGSTLSDPQSADDSLNIRQRQPVETSLGGARAAQYPTAPTLSLQETEGPKNEMFQQSSGQPPKSSILNQALSNIGDEMKLQKTAMSTGEQGFELPEALIKSVITQESSGNKKAVSKAGAQGLMQLMPATGREWHKKLGIEEPYDPFNPEQNRVIGTAYLKYLVDMYDGDLELALTAYNQGFGRVNKLLAKNRADSLDGIIDDLGPDGKKYAKMILKRMSKYEQVTA
jgi:soluble lytic murein transglycosylase-like protein